MSGTGFPSPAALRSGEAELIAHVQTVCDRIDAEDPLIQALLPEPARRQRLTREAEALLASFPDSAARPSLFGLLVGVKDFFRVDGFPTKAGSKLPAALFEGAESKVVTVLKQNGALVAGKTVTTEFAYFQPGPTRNPRNPGTYARRLEQRLGCGSGCRFLSAGAGHPDDRLGHPPGSLLWDYRLQAQLRPDPYL